MSQEVLGNQEVSKDKRTGTKELFRKDRMNWLPDDKEIFIGKLNYLKVVYKNISIFIEFYGKYLKTLANKFL